MWRHTPVGPAPRRASERSAMLLVLAALLLLYGGVAFGVTALGGTAHGRSLSVAGPIAILPR